ncbi:MAG: glycosyltransferase family 9 protein, partial [Anaerolineae bacterium]
MRREWVRLQLLKLVAHALRPPLSTGRPRPARLLLIRPDHIGDLLFTTPALQLLRETFPTAETTALVGPWAATVVERNPNVDIVLKCSFPWFDRRPKPSPWHPYRVLLREARRLRRYDFDTVLILRFDHWWGALLSALAGIPVRIGYATPETRPFLTTAIDYTPDRHAVSHNLALVEALAQTAGRVVPNIERRLRFDLTPGERAFARQFLAHHGIGSNEIVVGLHPGAGDPSKLWPARRWAAVADRLAEALGARIVITGSPAERDLAGTIAGYMRTMPLIAAGETTLGQAAALLNRCRLVIGADTGPMHLAVALGVPTVHLYGPFDPALFGPWGSPERHRIVRAPSGRVSDITEADVLAAVSATLEATAGK